MIYVSLESRQIDIGDRRKTYSTLSSIMPFIFEINKALGLLNKKHNVNCTVNIKIGNTLNLEVINV
jgi:hypothetical protein